jgi:uncharacterized delta-60 repeat protein
MKTKRTCSASLLACIGELLASCIHNKVTKRIGQLKHLALLITVTGLALPNLVMGQAGSLDPNFGVGGIATTPNTTAKTAALQSDGKIVVGGSISTVQNPQQSGVLRYDTRGALDTSFGTGGKLSIGGTNTGPVFAVAIQTDGKVLAAAPANFRLTVFRFNSNGTVDSTFGTNGAAAIDAAGLFLPPATGGLTLQSDGRILLATQRIVARLLVNGQLDPTFGSNGAAPTFGGDSVTVLPNGNILVGTGSLTSMYASNGTVVKSFGIHGQTPGFDFDKIGGFVVDNNSSTSAKIITAGSLFTDPNLVFAHNVSGFLLVSYHLDGTFDNTFGIHGGLTTPFPGNLLAHAFAVALQANGQIVAAGQTAVTDIDVIPGPSEFGLVRYNANGTVDTRFGNSGFVTTAFGNSVAFVNALLIQTDGKIVAIGNVNNATTLARYLAN